MFNSYRRDVARRAQSTHAGLLQGGSALRGRQRGMSILGVILLLALGIAVVTSGTVAALYFAGVIGSGEVRAEEPVESVVKPPVYLSLEPKLVVNVENRGRTGYLQMGVDVMARDQSVIDAVQAHMPVVRNNLLLLLGNQSHDDLTGRDAKESLRMQVLAEINKILAQRQVKGEVEAVYFTSFIMQ